MKVEEIKFTDRVAVGACGSGGGDEEEDEA
jgi:hypothetical protein